MFTIRNAYNCIQLKDTHTHSCMKFKHKNYIQYIVFYARISVCVLELYTITSISNGKHNL